MTLMLRIGYKMLFVIEAAAAVLMTFGIWTQNSMMVAYFLFSSSQRRSPAINASGDALFKYIIFWMCFIPEHPCTVDEGTFTWKHIKQLFKSKHTAQLNVGTAALNIQLGLMYFGSTFHKSFTAYVINADVVKQVLQMEIYSMMHPWALWMLANAPDFIFKFLARLSFFAEVICGVTLMAPFYSPEKWRAYNHAILILLQIGFWMFIRLGCFQWIMWAYHIGCMPTIVWDRVFGAANSKHSTAAATVSSPRPTNKKLIDRLNVVFREGLAALILGMVLLSNLNTMRRPRTDAFITNPYAGKIFPQGSIASQFEQIAGTRQIWNMFCFRTNIWSNGGRFVFVGTLTDGTKVNLQTLEEYNRARDHQPWDYKKWSKVYPFMLSREKNHMVWLFDATGSDPAQTEYLVDWMCYKYNRLMMRAKFNDNPLKKVTVYRIVYLLERLDIPMPKDAPTFKNPDTELLFNDQCEFNGAPYLPPPRPKGELPDPGQIVSWQDSLGKLPGNKEQRQELMARKRVKVED